MYRIGHLQLYIWCSFKSDKHGYACGFFWITFVMLLIYQGDVICIDYFCAVKVYSNATSVKWSDDVQVIYRIPEFLKSDFHEVRLATVANLAVLFDNNGNKNSDIDQSALLQDIFEKVGTLFSTPHKVV